MNLGSLLGVKETCLRFDEIRRATRTVDRSE